MAGADKLFTEVAGQPLLAHAIAPFQECASIERIVLVMAPLNLKRGRDLVERYGFTKAIALVKGGERRQDSVRLGLEALGGCEYVAVHDGARPLATPESPSLMRAATIDPMGSTSLPLSPTTRWPGVLKHADRPPLGWRSSTS